MTYQLFIGDGPQKVTGPTITALELRFFRKWARERCLYLVTAVREDGRRTLHLN